MLGLTRAQLEEAKKNNVKPAGGAGFAYIRGPDDALIEVQGDMPAERFNHVHMYHEEPFCSQLWYQKHLNVPVPQGRRGGAGRSRAPKRTAKCRAAPTRRGRRSTSTACTARRRSRSSSATSRWAATCARAMRRSVGTRGHLADHVGLSVADLDAWVAKLRAENVKIPRADPTQLGDTRAVMIEGPSREALELVEVK